MKNKVILTINALDDQKYYEKLGFHNFAFPLKNFCVGMPNSFLITEIPENGYLFINRILDNTGIDELKKLLKEPHFKGIIFDDLGILELIKDLKIEKILYLSHFNTNSESIKIYLEYVDSVIVSTDITKEEIVKINEQFTGQLTLFILGLIPSMYSRRKLLDNYSKFHHIPKKNPLLISNTSQNFLVYENDYGTIFYHYPFFNGLELMNLNAKYYFVNTAFLEKETVAKIFDGSYEGPFTQGFLYKETIYKLRGEDK